MEGIKSLNLNNEREKIRDKESHEHLEAETRKLVQRFLEEGTRKIGKGLSAEVHYFGKEDKACLKIISEKTLHESRKLNSTIVEAELQEKAFNFLKDTEGIKVPRPLFEKEFIFNNEDDEIERINIMCMERLDAVSIEEILDLQKELPNNFNFEDFFKKLKRGLSRLHDHGFHHRDFRPGNVMVDLETGDPCLIDFAMSVEAIGYENPYLESGIYSTTKYPSDEQGLREIRQKMMKFIVEKNSKR